MQFLSVDHTPMLPDEVLANIFQYLETSDVRNAAFVCKKWKEVAKMPTVWINRSLLLNLINSEHNQMKFKSVVK